MATVEQLQNQGPINLEWCGQDVDELGRARAFCPCCQGWLLLGNYKAQPLVFRQIYHDPECELQKKVIAIESKLRLDEQIEMFKHGIYGMRGTDNANQ